MMRKNALFIVFTCALSSLFSSLAFGDETKVNTALSQDFLQQQIVLTEARIQQLELEKSSYDAKAQAIGREADRIQFQFYTRARELYNQQQHYQTQSRALEQEIEALKQKKEKLRRQLRG